jgi:hypothetical protein
MPNINLYEVYKRKLNKYSIADLHDYRETFIDAVNLVYSELNEKVFEASVLEPIESFDAIIDKRLAALGSMTYDAACNTAISGREYWAAEWELERTSNTNSMTDTITDDNSNVVISITNGVVSVLGDSVQASATLPDVSDIVLRFESTPDGNAFLVNGDVLSTVYTTGDEETSQSVGTTSAHVLGSVTGYELKRTRWFTEGTLVWDFLLNEGSGTSNVTVSSRMVDPSSDIATLTAELSVAAWEYRYIDPSTSLDFRYRSALEAGLDWHLQVGGRWAMSDDQDLERRWYGRGIQSARSVYQQLTPYSNPLGI